MVFPGRFSTGCLRCRQRKVKCDEGKPTCRRCAIYGKPCTGYTDQFHFRHTRAKSNASTVTISIVPAPEKASNKATKQQPIKTSPWQIPAQNIRDNRQQLQQPPNQQSQPLWNLNSPLVRSPEACYDDVSLYYFIRRFVSPNPVDGFPGHLSFLPGLYDTYSHGLLETATLSVAQMAAYNKFGGEKFKVESYRNYGRAIKMMQNIIKTEDQATDDKVMASILLLCTLKDISGEESGNPNEHAPGLYYLIEKRGPEQIATSRGAELLFLALIRLQVHSFLHEDSTYGDPGDIASIWGTFDPLLRAMSLMSKTLSCRHRLISDLEQEQQNPENQHHQQQERASTVQGCFEILDHFHTWDNEAAAYWQSTFEGRGIPTALGQIASGATHYDVETACTLILIRSARLILLMSMIAYHYQMEHLKTAREPQTQSPPSPEQSDQQRQHYENIYSKGAALAALSTCIPSIESDVRKTIDDMLASVPYALGEIDASTRLPHTTGSSIPHDGAAAIIMVHSIRLVASCAYATDMQLRRAVEVLARFNSSIGIRAARGMDEEAVSAGLRNTRWAREQAFLRGVVLPGNEVQMGMGGTQVQTQGQFDELSPVSESSMSFGRSSSFSGEFGGMSPIVAGSEVVYSPTMLDSSSPCAEVVEGQLPDFGLGVGGLPMQVPDYGYSPTFT